MADGAGAGGGGGGGGAGGNWDPCECIWNHANSMARLLNYLRDSQSSCTEEDCTDQLPGLTGSAQSSAGWNMLMMLGMLLVATLLFVLRPASLRPSRRSIDEKPSRRDVRICVTLPDGAGGNEPPAPPIA